MQATNSSIQVIHKQLLSDSFQFQENAGDFLDRLSNIGKLLLLRESEPDLSQEIHELIIGGLEKIKELSEQLRELILQNSYDSNELNLLRTVLVNQSKLHLISDFPYVVAYEWNVYCYNPYTTLTEEHKGDLILMNEAYHFLIVELKFIKESDEFWRRVAKDRRLREVLRQANKFEDFFKQKFPWTYPQSLAITNRGIYSPKTKTLLQLIDFQA